MMEFTKVLFDNKWLQILEKDGWVYSHSPWCNAMGVALLAYKTIDGERRYLGRHETIPAHSLYGTESRLVSLTGGYDNGDKYTIAECALNELREEGGYDAPKTAMIPLGFAYPSKSSDTTMHLYAVDLDAVGVKECEATGDGTKNEEKSYVRWVTEQQIMYSLDPLNHTILLRLKQKGL